MTVFEVATASLRLTRRAHPGASTRPMTKLLGIVGVTAGSWLGWALGARLSLTAAVLLSIIGTGLGLYLGRRIAQDYF